MTYHSKSFRTIIITTIFLSTVIVLIPAMAYRDSANKAETLIKVMINENDTVIGRTVDIIQAKLELQLSDDTLSVIIADLLASDDKDDMTTKINRFIRMYRIMVTEEDYARFVDYMDSKRLYFKENNDSINRYLVEYESNLNSILGGTFMKIAGYPKSIVIKQEFEHGVDQ